jgi:hypothetical protein
LYRRKKTLADGTVRESLVWWIAYYVRGKLLRESTGTDIKTDADKILRARTCGRSGAATRRGGATHDAEGSA